MKIELNTQQCAEMEKARKVFNNVTGKGLSLAEFIAFAVDEMVTDNADAARAAQVVFGKVERHVH